MQSGSLFVAWHWLLRVQGVPTAPGPGVQSGSVWHDDGSSQSVRLSESLSSQSLHCDSGPMTHTLFAQAYPTRQSPDVMQPSRHTPWMDKPRSVHTASPVHGVVASQNSEQ